MEKKSHLIPVFRYSGGLANAAAMEIHAVGMTRWCGPLLVFIARGAVLNEAYGPRIQRLPVGCCVSCNGPQNLQQLPWILLEHTDRQEQPEWMKTPLFQAYSSVSSVFMPLRLLKKHKISHSVSKCWRFTVNYIYICTHTHTHAFFWQTIN